MIESLVESAFQTGCLSVASESLLRQLLSMRSCKPSELEVLASLEEALHKGQVKREAKDVSQAILSYSI